jgi:hypothetical protein
MVQRKEVRLQLKLKQTVVAKMSIRGQSEALKHRRETLPKLEVKGSRSSMKLMNKRRTRKTTRMSLMRK